MTCLWLLACTAACAIGWIARGLVAELNEHRNEEAADLAMDVTLERCRGFGAPPESRTMDRP